MINRVLLLGRLASEPVVSSLDPDLDPSSGADRLELVLPLTTFPSRAAANGDLDHDLQTIDVHVTGRVASLARLVLEPGQLLWVEGRLEGRSRGVDQGAAKDSGAGSPDRLRTVATWFTILASGGATEHLEAFAGVRQGSSFGRGGFAAEPLVSPLAGGAR